MPEQNHIVVREALGADMPGISRVRTSVVENLLTREQLAARGITEASVAASFLANSKGWVAGVCGRDRGLHDCRSRSRSIFALFVLPQWERRGLGGRLLDLALDWLRANGADLVWLTTGPDTRAARFYERRGWVATGTGPTGDRRYELRRSAPRGE